MDNKILIGLLPTRRNIFSKEAALEIKKLVQEKLISLKIDYVDIDDINEEGLLFDEIDVDNIINKFQNHGVNALFVPHCNFGTEDLISKVASKLKLPLLLWGPRDESPLKDGSRLRDTQCGLFATGKVLRRFNIPFTYMPNCRLSDEAFVRGISNFVRVANVIKEFNSIKILQISTRPADFWTMMCNEGELLEKFGIQLMPITISELVNEVIDIEKENSGELQRTIDFITNNMEIRVSLDEVKRISAIKCAIKKFAIKYKCSAIAIQCWNSLINELGVMPCVANALLTDEGIPVSCETDIHGAITSIIVQAASMNESATFFADWTVRHPQNDNGELLQHCGPWPISLAAPETRPKLIKSFVFSKEYAGSIAQLIQGGLISIVRFDGDHGQYSLLAGTARSIDGPYNEGSYLWIEVDDWLDLEEKLVTGPYVHHCVGVHGNITPVLYEACKYINGLNIDLYDKDAENNIKKWLRCE